MQEGIPNGDEASAWLREHFKGDPESRISIEWTEAEAEPGAYGRLLDILFAPQPGDWAA